MNNNMISELSLTVWIEGIKKCAEEDTADQVFWYVPTMNSPFSIVAGWMKAFSNGDFTDMFCCSKSQPEYVMCVKVISNEGPYAYADFESLNMPTDKLGEVDDTCIPLEWNDSAESAAQFFMHEWCRIMKEHGKEI